MPFLLTLGASYLLGSIPFSYLVARFFGVRDVRRVGSGNVGATNVMRSAGTLAGLVAFGLDASKGAAATAIAQRLDPSGLLPALAATGSVVGHVYPIWLGFRGGKGAATGAGAFAPIQPLASLGALVVFAAVALLTRYVSLGSITGAVALPALLGLLGAPQPVVVAASGVGALIIYKHRTNVARLRAGSERRMGERAS
jgi:acyl phosphate:glycerol-3-phosphate acyltransferase